MSLNDKIRTDAQREKMWPNTLPKGICSGQDLELHLLGGEEVVDDGSATGKIIKIKSEGTKQEIENYKNKSSNYYSAIRPFVLRKWKGETPMIYDLRRGQIDAAIAYVNGGASDFNMASLVPPHSNSKEPKETPKEELQDFINNEKEAIASFNEQGRIFCPSMMIAARFIHPTEALEKAERGGILSQRSLKSRIQTANDLIYIYTKLKENGMRYLSNKFDKKVIELDKPEKDKSDKGKKILENCDGLDHAAIDGRVNALLKSSNEVKREEGEHIKKALQQMEELSKIPEDQRFTELDVLVKTNMEDLPKDDIAYRKLCKDAVLKYHQRTEVKKETKEKTEKKPAQRDSLYTRTKRAVNNIFSR